MFYDLSKPKVGKTAFCPDKNYIVVPITACASVNGGRTFTVYVVREGFCSWKPEVQCSASGKHEMDCLASLIQEADELTRILNEIEEAREGLEKSKKKEKK